MTETLAMSMADFVVGTYFEDLPNDVVRRAEMNLVLDHLGDILGGSTTLSSKIMLDYVLSLGGKRESTIIGTTEKTSCPYAALANGTAADALELGDDDRVATTHPGVVNVPASLAVAEREQANGKTFLTAVVLAYETSRRIGAALLGISQREGFHPTATCGVFAAAAAAGKILRLSKAQMVNAFGIAGSLASGLMEFDIDGAYTKRLHPGRAAEGGIMAALLAQRGFTGPSTVFEGNRGFFKAYSFEHKYDLNGILDELGKKWMFMETTGVKPYASCRWTHVMIEPTIILTQKYRIKPEEVDYIEVKSFKSAMNMFQMTSGDKQPKYRPRKVVDAQFSGPFCVATAMLKERALHTEFTEETIKDPKILSLAEKVRGVFDPDAENAFPERYPCEVTIKLKDGNEYSYRVEYPKGDPENPVTHEEILEKFRALAGTVPLSEEKINGIIRLVQRLEKIDDISSETASLMSE